MGPFPSTSEEHRGAAGSCGSINSALQRSTLQKFPLLPIQVLLLIVFTSDVTRQSETRPAPVAPVAYHILQLRGGGKSQESGIVYVQEDTRASMAGKIKLVKKAKKEDPHIAVRDAFHSLAALVNGTTKDAGEDILFAESKKNAKTGRALKNNWWDRRGTTREDVAAYMRTKDDWFPDADEHPQLNADLATAAMYGRVHKIRDLVAKGAQVNAGGAGGSSMWAPLHHAARHGRRRAVRTLLDLGARVNISTWGRWSPLHLASVRGDAVMARMLLEAGAYLYAFNADGHTTFDVVSMNATDAAGMRALFTEFGFSDLANAAAKGEGIERFDR